MWCGQSGEHQHYAVSVREGKKLLGRLTPDGCVTTRNVHAAVLSLEKAERAAASINGGGHFTAKVIPF